MIIHYTPIYTLKPVDGKIPKRIYLPLQSEEGILTILEPNENSFKAYPNKVNKCYKKQWFLQPDEETPDGFDPLEFYSVGSGGGRVMLRRVNFKENDESSDEEIIRVYNPAKKWFLGYRVDAEGDWIICTTDWDDLILRNNQRMVFFESVPHVVEVMIIQRSPLQCALRRMHLGDKILGYD